MQHSLPLRIKLVEPPPGFAFCLQKGKGEKSERLDYQISEGKDLVFELDIDVRKGKKRGVANFVGPFAQGTPDVRFFYLCAGQYVEPDEPLWSGRVKIHLSSITWTTVEEVVADPNSVLEVSYAATGPKGGPALASVPLLNDGWKAVRFRGAFRGSRSRR